MTYFDIDPAWINQPHRPKVWEFLLLRADSTLIIGKKPWTAGNTVTINGVDFITFFNGFNLGEQN